MDVFRRLPQVGALILGLAFVPAGVAAQAPPADRPMRQPVESLLDGVPETLAPAPADQRRALIELFTEARSLEDRRMLREAADLLRQAERIAPEDSEVLRRLCRLSFAQGQVEEALAYGERALAADPTDSTTLGLMLAVLLERKGDRAAARSLLTRVLDHPRLPRDSAARLVALRLLGDLAYEIEGNTEAAADAYGAIVAGLDDRSAARITERDSRRILRGGEADSYLRFGEALLKAKRYDRAIVAFRRGLAYEPEHAQIPKLLAEAQFRSGDRVAALATLERYLRRQPQGREPYELLGELLKADGRAAEYLPRLEAAAQADPKNLALQFLLADVYRDSGRVAESEALLKKLLETQGDVQVYGPLIASLVKERRVPELVTTLGQAVSKPGGLDVVGPQIRAIAEDGALAADVLRRGVEWLKEGPQRIDDPTRRVLAFIATQAKQGDALIEMDRIVLEREPSAERYRELFTDLNNLGRHEEAAAALEQLMERHPGERNPIVLYALARSHLLSGRVEEALHSAREAERIEPAEDEVQFLIGYLLGRLGRFDEAIAHYRRLLETRGGNADAEMRARAGLSSVYSQAGDFENAEQELEILLEKHPDDAGVNNDLGYLYADRGKNLDRAEAMIRKALDQDPENSSYLDSLGWVLYKRGKTSESLDYLERAARDPNASATIHDHLGDAYFRLKRYEEADRAWERSEAIAGRARPPDRLADSVRAKRQALQALRNAEPDGRPRDP
jgi:tetratricopeptide (TPR) repeat protein